MHNEKSISIKEEQTNEMCPEPSTMFLGDPLGDYWSSDHINEDLKPNLGWDENENNNAVVNTLLHTILEAESECCPPPLLVPKKELFPDHTLGISCLTDFIKEDPELNLEADETENIVQVYPSSVNVKEEMEDGLNQEYLEDPLRVEDPGLHIKQDPELDLDVDAPEHNVVASRSYKSNRTRLLQSSERYDFSVEETVSQGVSHNELNISTEQSRNYIMFSEGEDEEKEESSPAPRLKYSLRGNKCQTFVCSVCQQSFTSKYELMMHVFVHIDGVEPPKSVCKSCCEVFPSYVSLKKHLKISEAEKDSFADKEETFDSSGKSFTQLSTLKDHALIHTRTRPHKCDICGKSFIRLSNLKVHASIHTGTQPHKCDNCGKSFTQSSHLKDHAIVHTASRPHKCDICGKSFTRLSTLKDHALIHTGTRPHKCDICGKSFIRLSHLKVHALLHTGTRPHKCDICGKCFTRLSYLKVHAFIHSGTRPHKCDVCSKSFTQLSYLKDHALIHTGTRPHKCDMCGKSFTRLSHLKEHSLIHTGTRPHKCDICGKCFTRLSYISRSMHHYTLERNPTSVTIVANLLLN